MTFGPEGKHETSFVLHAEELLLWDKWESEAKEYIRSARKGIIDVELLFRSYRERVGQFQEWVGDLIESVGSPELGQYRRYRAVVDQLASWRSWSMWIHQVVLQQKLDPYKYLDRYLTREQLEEVQALPQRSREQVDRIIELVDRDRACEYSHRGREEGKQLRTAVYQAFAVLDQEAKS
jgi:hypothetical protein